MTTKGALPWSLQHAKPVSMKPLVATLSWGRFVRSTPGGNAKRGTIGPRIATVPLVVARISPTITPPLLPRGTANGPKATPPVRPPAPRRAAIRPISPKTWMSTMSVPGSRQTGARARRSGAGHTASTLLRPSPTSERAGLRQLADQGARQDHRIEVHRALLSGEGVRVERVMERERPADQEPRQQGAGEARERRHRQRGEDRRVLLEPALEQDGEATRCQFGVAARDRDRAIGADIPGDDGEMRGRSRRIRTVLGRGQRIGRFEREQVVERHHAVGHVPSEAADEADMEGLDRGLHGVIELIVRADAPAHDQRTGTGATERVGDIGPPPQQRQRHRDHSGAQHRQERQHALDAVAELQADDRVRAHADPAQPAGDRRNHAIGLCIGEGAGREVGETLAVGWVDQRDRIRPPFDGATKQVVEGRATANARVHRFAVGFAEDHGAVLIAAKFSLRHRCHQVSGIGPDREVTSGCRTFVQRANHWSGG